MYVLSSVTTNSLDTASLLPKLDMLSRKEGLYTQCLISGSVLGRRHLDTAFVNAVKNFAYHENFARTFTLEVLLMLSAQRQIKEALEHYGLSQGSKSFLLFMTPRDRVKRLIRDFSIENVITYRKNFEIKFREYVMSGRDKLMNVLGMTEGWTISGNGSKKSQEIVPDRGMQKKLLALSGIKIKKKGTIDPEIIEKMVCEKINLIHCK